MSPWYLEKGEILDFELKGFERFKKEYNHPDFKYTIGKDVEEKLCVHVIMPCFQCGKANSTEKWIQAGFLIKYEQNCSEGDTYVIPEMRIEAYPLFRIKKGCDHLMSGEKGRVMVSLGKIERINSYKVLKKLVRWLVIHNHMIETETDLDKQNKKMEE